MGWRVSECTENGLIISEILYVLYIRASAVEKNVISELSSIAVKKCSTHRP